jgi:hypothetical protein
MAHNKHRRRRVVGSSLAVNKMPETIKRYEIILACSHSVYFTPPLPNVKDRLLCQRCQRYQTVTAKRREKATKLTLTD